MSEFLTLTSIQSAQVLNNVLNNKQSLWERPDIDSVVICNQQFTRMREYITFHLLAHSTYIYGMRPIPNQTVIYYFK